MAGARDGANGGALDVVAPVGFVPEHGSGFPGRPGLSGRRPNGSGWSPRFEVVGSTRTTPFMTTITSVDAIRRAEARHRDRTSSRRGRADRSRARQRGRRPVRPRRSLGEPGRTRARRRTRHVPRALVSRVPSRSAGRSQQERSSPRTVAVGRPTSRRPSCGRAHTGFGEHRGEVWGAHLAWSGNSRLSAERLPDGRAVITLGELLLPGEVVLDPGDSYRTPDVFAVYSPTGLNAASRRYHAIVRDHARPGPRPVMLNTWEAVYFDHDAATLAALAARAAEVGVERRARRRMVRRAPQRPQRTGRLVGVAATHIRSGSHH